MDRGARRDHPLATSTASPPPRAAPTSRGCARRSSRRCASFMETAGPGAQGRDHHRRRHPRGHRRRAVDLHARAAVPGADQGAAGQPRGAEPGRRRRPRRRWRPSCCENKTAGAAIVERIALAAKAREASRAASQAVSRKTAIIAPAEPARQAGRLLVDRSRARASCSSSRATRAGGSAKQGRERRTQAILPLRGKVLNTEQASLQKVLANKELQDVVSALGCGVGPDLKVERLRYHKIIFLMDADSDGHHIATLLLTFFYRHLQPLIAGRLRLPGPAAAVPHRPRQGDLLGAGRGRPRPHHRHAAQERPARDHALQGPGRDAARAS